MVELIQELYGIEWVDKDGIFGSSFSCGDVAPSGERGIVNILTATRSRCLTRLSFFSWFGGSQGSINLSLSIS